MSFDRTDPLISRVDAFSTSWTIDPEWEYPWPTLTELAVLFVLMFFLAPITLVVCGFLHWLLTHGLLVQVPFEAFRWVLGILVGLESLAALNMLLQARVPKTTFTLTQRHLSVCVHGRGTNTDRTERFELETLKRAYARPTGEGRSRIELRGMPGDPMFGIAADVDIAKALCNHIELAAVALRASGSEQEVPPSLQSIRQQRPTKRQTE